MTAYYLVQRMARKTSFREEGRGVDGEFSLDYMGSSEFEWGAVPASLKRMREQKVIVSERKLAFKGKQREVFFVGHADDSDAKWAALQAWVDGGMRGKEWSKFDDMLDGTDRDWPTDAWWSLEDDVAWSLNREYANALANAVNNAPTKS